MEQRPRPAGWLAFLRGTWKRLEWFERLVVGFLIATIVMAAVGFVAVRIFGVGAKEPLGHQHR